MLWLRKKTFQECQKSNSLSVSRLPLQGDAEEDAKWQSGCKSTAWLWWAPPAAFGHCITTSFLKGFQVWNWVSSFWLWDRFICFSLPRHGQRPGLCWARNAAPTGAANAAEGVLPWRMTGRVDSSAASNACRVLWLTHQQWLTLCAIKSHMCCGSDRALFQSLGCRYVYRCSHSMMLW